MIAIALAFASALTWGTGDFLGGLASRRWGLAWVLCATGCGGALLGVAISLTTGDPLPDGGTLTLAALAGLSGLSGLACFYHAFKIGTMSIVAPISASGAAIPVAWGLANGEQISTLTAVAIIVLITGVMLASREDSGDVGASGEGHVLSVLLALASAVFFGIVFTLLGETASASVYWPSAILKVATFAGAVVFVLIVRGVRGTDLGLRPLGWWWAFPVSVGFFDVTANMMFAAATTHGALAITAVVSSLFPVMTVLLAFIFLHERLSRLQLGGVVLAVLGVMALTMTAP